MSTTVTAPATERAPQLLGQTVVAIGGSSGMGLATARLARAEGAGVILTGRNPERLQQAAHELDALSATAFDVTDAERLERFFAELPKPIDHVMVTAGSPYYAKLVDMDFAQAQRAFDNGLMLGLRVARYSINKVRPGGTLVFMAGTAGHTDVGLSVYSPLTAALPALIANLALEVAPIRVNLIAAGFVDTPLSASLLDAGLERRREQLRATLPIGRVVGPADIAALAVQLMTNTALTGGTYPIDGGQRVVEAVARERGRL
jgi:NAD(P)-dependent dehydrogenase (short-subunit alcohol dehydrogenase family)